MNFDISVLVQNWQLLLQGYALTLLLLLLSIPLGIVGATVLALFRISGIRPLALLARSVVELVRNVPFLMQIFLIFFGLPFYGIRINATLAGVLCLGLYSAAYLSEGIRGAIEAIPRGQTEAAYALGLSYRQRMIYVVAPQLPAYLMPAATNVFITLGKETALLSLITVPELTYMAQSVLGRSFAPVEVFTAIALFYWATSELIAQIMRRLERRMTLPGSVN
jgi:His/Glu/Gln/Arg/opine family amino acid ABC transporter permease subunit